QHRDANGTDHVVKPETKRALLAAMRIPAGNVAEIRGSLAALADGPWRATLAPVILARAGEKLAIDVVVPQETAGSRLEAVLETEGGARTVLTFRPSDGALQDSRRVDGARREKWRVRLDAEAPLGVHRLTIGGDSATILASPGRTWHPAALD